MSYSGEEKRRHPRILLQARVIVHASERQLECLACNISEGGCLILPPAKARPGLALRVNVGIPGLPEWITADAVLVRETEFQGRYAWAVRFTAMTPHAGTLLRSYVRRTLRGEPEPQMSASAQPLLATEPGSGSGSGSDRAARPAPSATGRRVDATGPQIPVAAPGGLERRNTRERVASGGYARAGDATAGTRGTRPSGAHAPAPEPAPDAHPGKSGDDYTDPFADLPTAGKSALKDVAESRSGEFAAPAGDDDWEKAHSNVNLSKLYQAALDDVTPKKDEKKKKGWFSR